MEIHADLEPGCSQQRSGKLCLLDPWNKGTSSSLPAQPSPAHPRPLSGHRLESLKFPLACQAPPARGGVPWSWKTKGFTIKASERGKGEEEKRHQKVFPRSGPAGKRKGESCGFFPPHLQDVGTGVSPKISYLPSVAPRWEEDDGISSCGTQICLSGQCCPCLAPKRKRLYFGVEKSGLNSGGEAEGREQTGILALYSQSHPSF